MKNFAGDWDLNIWSLASDGRKVVGSGKALGTTEGDNATRIVIASFESAEFPEATGGYEADSNRYIFYLVGGPVVKSPLELTAYRCDSKFARWTGIYGKRLRLRTLTVNRHRFSRRGSSDARAGFDRTGLVETK